MTAAAIALASALLIVFLAALAMDWWESRAEWREWQQDHPAHDEPPSRLDELDGWPSRQPKRDELWP